MCVFTRPELVVNEATYTGARHWEILGFNCVENCLGSACLGPVPGFGRAPLPSAQVEHACRAQDRVLAAEVWLTLHIICFRPSVSPRVLQQHLY